MDEATRKQIIGRIRSEAAALAESDSRFVEACLGILMKLASDPEMGPLTFLMPDEQAVQRIDFEGDIPPELRDQCLGLLLDQVIIGKLPSTGSGDARQFSTLGGATAILSSDADGLVLTDTTGRRVRFSDPVVDGPKLTLRQSDDLLMWDEWAWN